MTFSDFLFYYITISASDCFEYIEIILARFETEVTRLTKLSVKLMRLLLKISLLPWSKQC